MQNPRKRKRKKNFARTGKWIFRYWFVYYVSYILLRKNGGTFAITSPAVEQYREYVQVDLQDSDRLGAAKPRGKSRRRFDPQCNIVRLPADQGIDVCWINVSPPGLCDATVERFSRSKISQASKTCGAFVGVQAGESGTVGIMSFVMFALCEDAASNILVGIIG